MDSEDFKKLSRAEAVKTALWPSDMAEVLKVADQVAQLKGVYGELVYYRDDGEELAVIWWDGESETWLVSWLRGSGA
jgi:hypothetical protein